MLSTKGGDGCLKAGAHTNLQSRNFRQGLEWKLSFDPKF